MESVIEVKKASKKAKQKAAPAKADKNIDANEYALRIEKKAYELFLQRGGEHGHDWDDWYQAEKLVEEELISGK